MKNRLLLLVFLMIFPGYLFAQVQFEATASKKTLGINERLRVDFKMNRDGDNFNPPPFSDFKVIGGPNQAVSNTWVNGESTYSKTYSYYLAPKSRGTLTIGQAEITIDGEVYKTVPLKIEVTAAVDEPTDGDNSDFVASENLHLVAEISDPNPFLNEGISVIYKLYVSPRINVSDWRQIDIPTYNGFWSQNIDIDRLRVQSGEYKGESYRYVVLRKTVLYPQKAGKLDIEPLTLSVSVEVPTNRRDIFGNVFYETVEKRIAAGNRTIEVKPLPQKGKPAGFTGAVGRDLNFEVSVNKQDLKATESLEAEVGVSGQGNLKLFDLPALTVPASMEKYEPEYSEEVRTDLSGMHGTIANKYTLVPQASGKYPIPSLSFSYFDLESETYKTLTSAEIVIEVDPAPAGTNLSSQNNGRPSGKPLPNSSQFRYIKLNTTLRPAGQPSFIGSVNFWILLLLPVLALPLILVLGKRKQKKSGDVAGRRLRQANKLARKYLSEAKKSLGNQKRFYESLERALHNYLKAKLHIQTSEMSKERIEELLQYKGVQKDTISNFIRLLEDCEFARYSPASTVVMEEEYKKAVAVISEIDKQI